ncbi:MAG: hypothetical protein IT391_15255 [Nitrospira sp.]|nr:hypothetical protein [Nitrospira sp.]
MAILTVFLRDFWEMQDGWESNARPMGRDSPTLWDGLVGYRTMFLHGGSRETRHK